MVFLKNESAQTERADLWLPRGRGWGREGVGVWGQQMQTSVYKDG